MDVIAYREALLALLPPGAAFPRDPDTTLAALLTALAEELARVDRRLKELLEEADPRTTKELLAEWLAVYGVAEGGSSAEDQAALVAAIARRGGQSVAYFIDLAAALGYTVTITEFRPPVSGDAECGEAEAATEDQIFVWTVNSPTYTEFPAETGDAECAAADCDGTVTNALLEAAFAAKKPSHTLVLHTYGG